MVEFAEARKTDAELTFDRKHDTDIFEAYVSGYEENIAPNKDKWLINEKDGNIRFSLGENLEQ